MSLQCPKCGQGEAGFLAYRPCVHKLRVDAEMNVLHDDEGAQEGPGEIDEFVCDPCGHAWKPEVPETLGGRGSVTKRYERAARLAAAADAVELRVLPLLPGDPARSAFYAFKEAAAADLAAVAEEHSLKEGWVYGEESPGAGLHPDDVHPGLARRVLVFVGPFPMYVGEAEDPGGVTVEVVVESESDLEQWARARGLPFAYVKPLPAAEHTPGQRSNWRDVLPVRDP